MLERRNLDHAEELVVVDRVEGLREIDGQRHGTVGGFLLVETPGNLLGEWEEGRGGGALGTEPMLRLSDREVQMQAGKEEPLQDLHCRAEERDGAV